jgi:hypothetical protein
MPPSKIWAGQPAPFRFAVLAHQHHHPTIAISADGLTRQIVLVRSGDSWRVMQRPSAGGAPRGRAGGPLDALQMHEIADRALREHGLDPQKATWDDISARLR